MTVQTTPQEYRVTDPHALTVVPASGGPPVLDVDTLTRTLRLRGRLMLNTRDMGLAHDRLDSHMDAYNGTFLEPFTFAVVSDGVAVIGTLDRNPTGDLTERFSDGYSTISTTLTIVLTPGSDTAPQKNFVYILQSAKGVLVGSTSDWPSEEHIKIAEVILQTVGTTQTEGGPLVTRFWNDHAQGTNNQGHHTHAWQRLRFEHALWKSGVAITWTIDAVPSPDTVHLALTAGRIYQLHLHDFEAKDTTAGDNVHVVNDSVSPYTEVTDFASLLTDSAGISMSGRYFNLVVWASISSGSEKEHLFVNLPSGSYNKLSDAIADVSGFTVFDIPSDFRGIAFLVTRITLRHQAAGGGTWTSEQETDLRGQVPNIIAGGGTAAITTEFADNQFKLFDDGDPTKELAFQLSGITTGNVRTVTVPDKDLTLIDAADAIAAVEGEATLVLTGEASIASGKSLSLLTDGSTGGVKFGASSDVILFRGAANRLDLGTGDDLRLVSGDIELVTGKVVDIFNSFGDANPLARYSSDRIEFGSGGASALDSIFRRNAAGQFTLERTSADIFLRGFITGESHPRWTIDQEGINFGSGSATEDITFGRTLLAGTLAAFNVFALDSGQLAGVDLSDYVSVTTGPLAIRLFVVGAGTKEANPRARYAHDRIEFGAGGASALDVNLYRNAADELKTDDKFIIGAGLEVTGNSDFGAFYLDIDDIAVPSNPGVGVRRLFTDTATGELSVRTNAGATVSLEAASAGVAAHNILDGVVHLDSIAQGVTRGSLIYGNATPNWDELVIGAADTILASDGADFSWTGGPSLSGILTVDTINEFTGAAGVDIEGVQLLDSFIEFDEISTPSAPAAAKGRVYFKDWNGVTLPMYQDSSGNERIMPGVFRELPLSSADDATSLVGSGALRYGTGRWGVDSLGTNPSNAIIDTGNHLQVTIGSNSEVVNWSRKILLRVRFAVVTAAAGGLAGIELGRPSGAVTTYTGRMIGVSIDNRALRGRVHDGSTLTTTATLAALTNSQTYELLIVSDGAGTVEWFLDGASIGSDANGPSGNGTNGECTFWLGVFNRGGREQVYVTRVEIADFA